ncbi:hypothetical protein SS37A_10060 [Methylocystis iwaonis]|uniref:Uncharacterized protein n=1 Tax=Methylocystis iwaonis TaxID=2885079 RepID=A0ABM8E6K9_9HYPH|nr:hypothetical protein SS37A_10060 [Methylocystis iwaonis]
MRLRQDHFRGGKFGFGLLRLELEVVFVQRRQGGAGLHLLAGLNETLHNLAGDAETEVRFDARADGRDKIPRLRLRREPRLSDKHRPIIGRVARLVVTLAGREPERDDKSSNRRRN